MKKIHLSRVIALIRESVENKTKKVFDLKVVLKGTGEIRTMRGYFTSLHEKGPTLNIMEEGNTRPKTIVKVLIIEFQGVEVIL